MRLSIFHSTSRALREFFLVLVQGYERAPRVSQLPNKNLKKYNYFHHIIGTTGVQCEKMPKMNHIISKIKNIKIKSVINKVNKTNDKK